MCSNNTKRGLSTQVFSQELQVRNKYTLLPKLSRRSLPDIESEVFRSSRAIFQSKPAISCSYRQFL